MTKHANLRPHVRDVSLPSVQQRIQKWLDDQSSFPVLGSEAEYGFFAEKCYPIPDDRRGYFQKLAMQAKAHTGYQVMGMLAQDQIVRAVWTTNFDALPGKIAKDASIVPIEVGLDSAHRIERMPRRGELLCVYLHGDYRYDALKNTSAELQQQDAELRAALVEHARNSTMIVVGYSGRDASIMDSLHDAYSRLGPGRLYWCGHADNEPPAAVQALLNTARAHNRTSYYVPVAGFDNLMIRLANHCLAGERLEEARHVYSVTLPDSTPQLPPFQIEHEFTAGILKSNAFPLECPGELYQFTVKDITVPSFWGWLRQQTEGKDCVAGPLGPKVLALGTTASITEAFGQYMTGEIELTPINEQDLSLENGVVVSLMTQALARAIATERDLATDGRDLVWSKDHSSQTKAYDTLCQVHDAALISIRRYAGQQYLVVKPTIKGFTVNGENLIRETDKELKRLVLTKQYNRQFNEAVNRWIKLLFPRGQTPQEPVRFQFPATGLSVFKYVLRGKPAWAAIKTSEYQRKIEVPAAVLGQMPFSGAEVNEPALIFSNKRGDGTVADQHPVRGLVTNRPYDFPLTISGLSSEIRLGVVCPAQDSARLSTYLLALHSRKQPDSKREYLLDYPGFSSLFGLPLDVPQPRGGRWVDCSEPNNTADSRMGAVELGRSINRAIESLHASSAPNVVLVFIPNRWDAFERYIGEHDSFDLHDFVKAYCVQRGIATQFLREETIYKEYQGEVIWWLALSLYVKAMRTPWLLGTMDTQTAFVGLGFVHGKAADAASQIVVGCSHIYNAQGFGLRYNLSKIDRPVFWQKNPHLSRLDARQFGDNVRQMFYESMMRLPKRVVIHKRTPFLRGERDGLVEGLTGVEQVDMVEITEDPVTRYIASRRGKEGWEPDPFPVRRGTVVVQDKERAWVWVHGTSDAVIPRQRYYLGKSRIPAPLVITRHYGQSSLSTLVAEIIGLSKMNWNTFDMYSKMPATIQSSNAIARIGSLLERFGHTVYDYRLFI